MIMRGLYSSLIPPDISCLAGWPSHFLPGLRETETERSVVHSFFFFQRSKWRNAGVQDGAMKAEEERN